VNSIEAEGVRFNLLYRAPEEFRDTDRATLRSTTSKLVRSAVRLFGGAPLNQFGFLFLRRQGDSFAGLEGASSCQAAVGKGIDISDPSEPPSNYFYSLIAHEFIHSWNPISFLSTSNWDGGPNKVSRK
jgi:predicted metalloprotease with PDZ domain